MIPSHPLIYSLSVNVQGVCSSPLQFIDVRRLAALSYRVPMLEVIANATTQDEIYEYARAITLIRAVALMMVSNNSSSKMANQTSLSTKKNKKQQNAESSNFKNPTLLFKNDIIGSNFNSRNYILDSVIPYTNNELRSIIQSTGALLPHHVMPQKREAALRVVAIAVAPLIAKQILRSQS